MQERSDPDHELLELRKQMEQLKHALHSNALIDQAIGVVITYGGVQPSQGRAVLKEISQHTDIQLREVAEHVVQWPRSTWLPPEIRSALDTALERQRRW
jgi:AmiR/NasT family two-component response regulator